MGENKFYTFIFAAVVFIAPFIYGLFPAPAIYAAGIAVAMCFAAYSIGPNSRNALLTHGRKLQFLDWGVLLYLLGYIIAATTAVQANNNAEMIIRALIYLMVYLIASGLARYTENTKRILSAIYSSGVVVSLIGILAAGGVSLITDALLEGRISSTFQYPNTLGAYLSAIGILGVFLAVHCEGKWKKYLYLACNILIYTAFFGTESRGALAAMVVAYLVSIAFQPSEYRMKFTRILGIGLIPGWLVYTLFSGKQGQVIWLYVLMGILIALVIEMIAEKIESNWMQGNKNLKVGVFVGVGVLAVIFLLAILPEKAIFSRMLNFKITDRNFVERLYFYKDSFKIIKDHPITGVGGGGWASLYKAYRTYGYVSTQVHNFYLQTWVEAGLLGLGSLVFLLLGVLKNFIQLVKTGNSSKRSMAVLLTSFIISILFESALDFTMSYGAVAILVWIMFGLLRTEAENADVVKRSTHEANSGRLTYYKYAGLSISIIVILVCSSFLLAMQYERKWIQIITTSKTYPENDYLEKMKTFNPLYPDTYINLSRFEREKYRRDRNPEHLKIALDYADRAIQLDKGSVNSRVERINNLFGLKRYNEVPQEAETAYRLDPWGQDSFGLLAYTYYVAGKEAYKSGDTEKAKEYLNKSIRVPIEMRKKMESLSPQEKTLWVQSKPIFDKRLQGYVIKAINLRKRIK